VFGGKFGRRLDILVNNAGTVDFGPFLESAEDSYEKHFNLNVRSLIALTKDIAPRMIKAGWGRIINIGSCHGGAAALPGVTPYVATKFAVRARAKVIFTLLYILIYLLLTLEDNALLVGGLPVSWQPQLQCISLKELSGTARFEPPRCSPASLLA
jgi:hypothetical protein